GVAGAAQDFGPAHAITSVKFGFDGILVLRCIKARPAGTGVEFGFRTEKFIAATCTAVNTVFVTIIIFAGKRALGTFLAAYSKLFRCQLPFPFIFRLSDFFVCHGLTPRRKTL